MLFITLLPIADVRAQLAFELTVDGERPDTIYTDKQKIPCPDSAEGFQLEVIGIGEPVDFALSFVNKPVHAYGDVTGTFDINTSLSVSFSEDGLPGIECKYIISSLDSVPGQGIVELEFSFDSNSSSRNGVSETATTSVLYPGNTAAEWIRDKYPDLKPTQYGLELPATCTVSDFCGSRYTHLFFDQYGNSLCSVVPQGIPGRQYVVHVVYLQSTDSETMDFLVNQTAGEYLDSYVLRNAGNLDSMTATLTSRNASTKHSGSQFCWTESVTSLNTSTTDIQIEISGIVYQQGLESVDNSVLIATRGIHMTPIYHGSLDIGIVSSFLSDPEYSLVMQTDSVGLLRITDDGNRGLVTVMATMYSSPVVWIQSLFDKEIPSYKLYGRNFLDDHAWYQRFYPTIGLEVSSSALESFLGGLSFEFARGGNLFGGVHYGKVSRMNLPEGFIEGQTPISEEEFNLLLEEEWDIGFAFGLSLDIGVITKLIGD